VFKNSLEVLTFVHTLIYVFLGRYVIAHSGSVVTSAELAGFLS